MLSGTWGERMERLHREGIFGDGDAAAEVVEGGGEAVNAVAVAAGLQRAAEEDVVAVEAHRRVGHQCDAIAGEDPTGHRSVE